MNTPQNIKELKKLIKKYESITIEEIEGVWNNEENIYCYGDTIAQQLTGFGTMGSCTLCKRVDEKCDFCVYQIDMGCVRAVHKETYDNITNSLTPEELYDAFQKRAKHLKEHFKDIL